VFETIKKPKGKSLHFGIVKHVVAWGMIQCGGIVLR